MDDYLSQKNNYNLLSLTDLIQARDLYHAHLTNKPNVIATALGYYRIRKGDPWPKGWPGSKDPKRSTRGSGPKYLETTEVRPYSWPCILVFVDRWIDETDPRESKALEKHDYIPPAVYMPDGRVVPVCVIAAPLEARAPSTVEALRFPDNRIGGGYPVLTTVQNQEHVASIGCLVTDGHTVYALTNRHVAGQPGAELRTRLRGQDVVVGKSSDKQLTRRPFSSVYPGWGGDNVYVNLDVGLIEVDDLTKWTAQLYGIGQLGVLADLSTQNITLRLIGCPVAAYGCASKRMQGRIEALFYRYKSVGGFEYVSDFLIGPRDNEAFGTHPGDSGTVWVMETGDKNERMPIALQWGGHVLVADGKSQRQPYALATCLSTVCNLLEVDVVRDFNVGLPDYWGAVGHYSIAARAIEFVDHPSLEEFLNANEANVSYPVDQINDKRMKGLSNQEFVPLADVPDMAWKRGKFNRGQPEHPNHFADMDKPGEDGRTLLDIVKDPKQRTDPTVWEKYYEAIGDDSHGLLPFRVWQLYDEMVAAAQKGDAARFLCAGGVLAHYVGDACQPLHISYMFNGDPDTKAGVGVHSAYEDGMVNANTKAIVDGIDPKKANKKWGANVSSAQEAASAVIMLMEDTFATIQPKQIVDAYVDCQKKKLKPRDVSVALWKAFGKDTIQIMTDGCACLAQLWRSAWLQGGADKTVTDHEAIEQKDLIAIYGDRTFARSMTLQTWIAQYPWNGARAGGSANVSPIAGRKPRAKAAGKKAPAASAKTRTPKAHPPAKRKTPRKAARSARPAKARRRGQ